MSTELRTTGSSIWRSNLPLDRKSYFYAGTSLMVIKYIVDVLISRFVFHTSWTLLDYIVPGSAFNIASIPVGALNFYLTMLAVSLPYAFVGSVLTIRRLRGAKLPDWLVVLFYVPVVNLFFFLMLCFFPNKREAISSAGSGQPRQSLEGEAKSKHNLDAVARETPPTISANPCKSEQVKEQEQEQEKQPSDDFTPGPEAGSAIKIEGLDAIKGGDPFTNSAAPPSQTPQRLDSQAQPETKARHHGETVFKEASPQEDEHIRIVPESEAPLPAPLPSGESAREAPVEAVTFVSPRKLDEPLLGALIPEDDKRAIWVSAFVPIPVSILLCLFAVFALGSYGWGLFVGVPFAASIAAPLLYAYRKQRTLMECMKVSTLSVMMIASVMLLIPLEGVICLAMASPLVFAIGAIGALVAWAVQHRDKEMPQLPTMVGCMLMLVPLVMIGESYSAPQSPLYELSSTVEVDAPAARVWSNLIDFPPLPAPKENLFKIGIAYPIQATISGRGPGAVRRCVFSTGAFVEPITVWDEPRQLKFGVRSQPAPMHELSLYPDLHPRHLNGYLVTKSGEFLLQPLAGNRCRLIGTTWYENHMGPGPYWKLWSDSIIHRIHLRVLNHVKNLSESPVVTMKVETH